MSARDSVIAYVVNGGLSTARATANVDRLIADTRAATLREAADVAESLRQFERVTGPRRSAQVSENVGILRVADVFRRMAEEGTV